MGDQPATEMMPIGDRAESNTKKPNVKKPDVKKSGAKKKARRVTIHTVAKVAGVSPATVSNVLNDAPYVSQAMRQRVLSVVETLNFKPNSVARSLKTKSTATIGLVTNDIDGVFTMPMMRGVEEAVSAQGLSVLLCNAYGGAQREREHLELLLNKQVDGIILMNGNRVHERSVPALPLDEVPVVYLFQYTHDLPLPCVVPDNFGGGALGTRHLISLGRRRVALINGPAYHYDATHLRLEGYRYALKEAGLPFDPALLRAGEWTEQSGYALAHELMALPEPPDAIFCCNDNLAIGALDALHELGVAVPGEVALVGFNNSYSSEYQRPPLTSVALPLLEMGKLAGELLAAAVRGTPAEPEVHRVPCDLVQRESCGGG